jgi:hypothetical protein
MPEKEPQVFKSGNVELVFKIEQSTAIPKGLSPLKECLCTVRVGPKSWKKVQEKLQPESRFLIQGEVTSLGGKLEVVAMDIGLLEKKGKEKVEGEQAKEQEPAAPPKGKKTSIRLATVKGMVKFEELASITIPEGLESPSSLEVEGAVEYIQTYKKFEKPLLLMEESNVLRGGYAYYLAAKKLDIEKVPIAYKPKEQAIVAQEIKAQSKKLYEKKHVRPAPPMETWGIMPLADIRVPEHFLKTPVSPKKIQEMMEYIQANKKFDKPLFVNASNWLIDGYKRYVAAKELQLENVPVVIEMVKSQMVKEKTSTPTEEREIRSNIAQELSDDKADQEDLKEESVAQKKVRKPRKKKQDEEEATDEPKEALI